jgi:hypothetical protein
MTMTEHQEHTQQAAEVGGHSTVECPPDRTTASALGADADTTWVPADPATVDAWAWSQGEDPEEPDSSGSDRHPWTRVLAIAAGVLALGTVTAVVVTANGQHANDLHESALPVTVHPSVAAAPPSAPVVAAPGFDIHQMSSAPVVPVDKDARFMALIEPQHYPPAVMDRITGYARGLCRSIAKGDTTRAGEIARVLGVATDLTIDQVTFLVNTAVEVYCPQFTGTGPVVSAPGPVPDEG